MKSYEINRIAYDIAWQVLDAAAHDIDGWSVDNLTDTDIRRISKQIDKTAQEMFNRRERAKEYITYKETQHGSN